MACTVGLAFVSATTAGVLAEIDLDDGFTAEALAVGVFAAGVLAGGSADTADFFGAAAGFTGTGALFGALATDFTGALALTGVALVVLAFTFRLLTETRGALLRGVSFPALGAVAPGPSARECTGNPMGKPIICNSVTNIALMRKSVF
jgi:hypothetical protein